MAAVVKGAVESDADAHAIIDLRGADEPGAAPPPAPPSRTIESQPLPPLAPR